MELMPWIDERITERFDRIDERFDEVNRRFDGVNKRLDEVKQEVAELRQGTWALQTTLSRVNLSVIVGPIGIIVAIVVKG
jgi:archaellum component FlaC